MTDDARSRIASAVDHLAMVFNPENPIARKGHNRKHAKLRKDLLAMSPLPDPDDVETVVSQWTSSGTSFPESPEFIAALAVLVRKRLGIDLDDTGQSPRSARVFEGYNLGLSSREKPFRWVVDANGQPFLNPTNTFGEPTNHPFRSRQRGRQFLTPNEVEKILTGKASQNASGWWTFADGDKPIPHGIDETPGGHIPLSAAEIAKLSPDMVKLGLNAHWLTRDGDGNLHDTGR